MKTPTPLTLGDAQRAVDQWIQQWEEGYFSPLSNLARLTEEVGELARHINVAHGDKPGATDEEGLAEELGDILFVVIALANSMTIDLDDALRTTLKKYQIRDAHRFTPTESE